MFKINSFKDFNLSFSSILERKLWIWSKDENHKSSFRIEDLLNSSIYKNEDVKGWMSKYGFDRWAIAVFVTKTPPKKGSFIKRYDDRTPQRSEFGELLDSGDLDAIEKYIDENPGGIDLTKLSNNQIDIKLRTSSKGLRSKMYFDSKSKSREGHLIKESGFHYSGQKVFLYVFKKSSHDGIRARQLRGILYEKNVRTSFGLTEKTKGEKWDAWGSLELDKLLQRAESAQLYLNGSDDKNIIDDLNKIPKGFLNDINWSIKSCDIRPGNAIYFGDFKRISGLESIGKSPNYKLKLVDKTESNFILFVGFHSGGKFKEEYIINVNVEKWKKLIPDMTNRDVISKLEDMYNNLEQHRLGSDSNPGKRTVDTEKAWELYRKTYSQITKDFGIKLNFKRDTKGQLRIQCSMSKNFFFNTLLKGNDYILIKY